MPAIDPFEAERKALQSLMGENRFFIPDLQRPFSWGEEQVEDLINDIVSVLRASSDAGEPERHGHFLGTIVTQQEPVGTRLAILDGQQRMTCLTLLIALVAREARLLLSRCTTDAETERVRSSSASWSGSFSSNPTARAIAHRGSRRLLRSGRRWPASCVAETARFRTNHSPPR